MFRILIKEKQFGHKEYLSVFWGVVRVHTVTMVVFKKYVNTVDVMYSSQHNIKLSSISNCSCPCTGICISINCIIRQFKVSSEMDTYGIEWLFFQRKDHLKNNFKKNQNVTRYIHPIFHTCNSKPYMYMREKPNICRKIRMNQLRKKIKVIKKRDFYKVSKHIHKYKI